MKTLILIPSRLSAVRLPGKPLLKINGLSIISHVFKKAVESNIGEVFVAAEDQDIIDDIKKNGGQAILTGNHHKTGTDRIHEALKQGGYAPQVRDGPSERPRAASGPDRGARRVCRRARPQLWPGGACFATQGLHRPVTHCEADVVNGVEKSSRPKSILGSMAN